MVDKVWLTSEQRDIQDVARSFLQQRYPVSRIHELVEDDQADLTEGWDEIVDLGWTAVGLPEEQGGAGFGSIERCLLLQEMGRVLLPAPYLSSAVLARDVLATVARSDAGDELLASAAEGSKRLTIVAAGDLHGSTSLSGRITVDDSDRVSGESGTIVDATTADLLVVIAEERGGALAIFGVDATGDGVDRTTIRLVDETRSYGRVLLDGAAGQRLDEKGDAKDSLAWGFASASIGLSAEMVGGAQHCLELTLEYVQQREQFGVPIGSFQAIKHRLADLAVMIDAAEESVYLAAQLADETQGDVVLQAASAAKAAVSDAYEVMTAETIQLHGGIGFTWEHQAHLYYKRAKISASLLGSAIQHREHLGNQLTASSRR